MLTASDSTVCATLFGAYAVLGQLDLLLYVTTVNLTMSAMLLRVHYTLLAYSRA
jgi:hypothetical protein